MGRPERLCDRLGAASLFTGLSLADLDRIAAATEPDAFDPNQRIFARGEAAEALFFVESGEVELLMASGRSRLLSAGDTAGEMGLVPRTTRGTSATARTRVTGAWLRRAAFEGLLAARDPLAFHVLERLARLLAARLRDIEPHVLEPVDDGAPAIAEAVARPTPVDPGHLPFLGLLAFFAGFDEELLAELATSMRQWSLPAGVSLFREGAPGQSGFVTIKGAVELSVQRGGRRHRFAVLGPGRIFGDVSLIDGGPRPVTCTTREEVVVLELTRGAYEGLLRARSLLAFRLLEAQVSELARAIQRADKSFGGAGEARADRPRARYDGEALVERIRGAVIGQGVVLEGPFGPCRMIYADYTASGRSLAFIEDFMRHEVMPLYANTHTEASGTGRQTTALRESARALIKRAVNGGVDDCVIFCGSGATGAIDKLQGVLGLKLPDELERRHGLLEHIPREERPLVFVGPYEHHSNDVSWRTTIAEVIMIHEDADGRIDLAHLEEMLVRHADRRFKIGSFSAASNVTGLKTDTVELGALLHRHGALALWDYAAAGPYVDIDMNPPGAPKDAIFLSPHKFPGGPGTPGVLVVKRRLLRNRIPVVPGGGTVRYVSPTAHDFIADPEHREEGGTPDILGAIRAGLVFQLKDAVGTELIEEKERGFLRRAIERWRAHDRIWILGNPELDRLSIVSFVIRHGDRHLHHNFVVAVLNDVFGIQARGGCSCAGPYGHSLFSIGPELSRRYQCQIGLGYEGVKPGWVRVNFNYFISEAELEYILRAVELIASDGWRLLPWYGFDVDTAQWRHVEDRRKNILDLERLRYSGGSLEFRSNRTEEPESALARYLERGQAILRDAQRPAAPPEETEVVRGLGDLRWFTLPSEAWAQLEPAERRPEVR